MKTIKRIKWMLAICLFNISSIFAQIGNLVDDPNKEWCYLKKSTTVIGMPFNPQVTEVTYDGSLYTGYAELCFHYGKNDTPILIRQKTFKDGWIPVVGDCWKDGNIQYQIEMFAAPLNDSDVSNCINFVKITMSNTGKEKATGYFNISTRGKVDDYRLAELKNFSEDNLYEIQNGKVNKDNKMLFTFSDGFNRIEAIEGTPYTQPFTGKSLHITKETRSAIIYYQKDLKKNEKYEIILKMPCIPVSNAIAEDIIKADYEMYFKKTVSFWKRLIGNETYFEIPEKRIQDAQRASMVHLLLATRTFPDGHKTQTDGIPYPNFFLTSGPQMTMAYLTNGCPEYAKMIVKNAILQQEPNGLYFDKSLAHGPKNPWSHLCFQNDTCKVLCVPIFSWVCLKKSPKSNRNRYRI